MVVPRFFLRHTLLLLLTAALITGAFAYKDYGVGWDEQVSYATGLVNYNYVFKGDTALLSHLNRDYGVAFELPAVIAQKALGLEDLREIYLLRRILTHLLFITACACMFLLVQLLYDDTLISATCFLALWMHPHIFAYSFFNSKDLPFLSLLVISLYLLCRAMYNRNTIVFCAAGVAMGLLTGTRIMGILFVALAACWIIVRSFSAGNRKSLISGLLLFLLFWAGFLYASWPFLWNDPVAHFVQAFRNMSKFRWELDVLYLGDYVNAALVPWHYIPVWMSVTTPLLVLLAGIAGSALVIRRFHRLSRPVSLQTQAEGMFLLFFILPVAGVIVMHSVIYDSWRHLYFIFGPFVLLIACALHELKQKLDKKFLVISCVGLVAPPVLFNVLAHPFQHVYFSPLAGKGDVRQRYEMDYWGVSYKQSLEYLLSIEPEGTINIAAQNQPCEHNVDFLPAGQRERFRFAPLEEAEYFLTNYRWHPHEYTDLPVKVRKIRSFEVQGNAFQSVYRIVR